MVVDIINADLDHVLRTYAFELGINYKPKYELHEFFMKTFYFFIFIMKLLPYVHLSAKN